MNIKYSSEVSRKAHSQLSSIKQPLGYTIQVHEGASFLMMKQQHNLILPASTRGLLLVKSNTLHATDKSHLAVAAEAGW